jgi:hypothetical protein
MHSSTSNDWLNESLGFLMRRILATISIRVDDELGSSGLTNALWVPLLMLYAGRGTTVAELAPRMPHGSRSLHGFTAKETALLKSMLDRMLDNLRADRR